MHEILKKKRTKTLILYTVYALKVKVFSRLPLLLRPPRGQLLRAPGARQKAT